jgi:hypothetical protein
VSGKITLTVNRSRHRVVRRAKGDEERIPLRIDDSTPVRGKRRPQNLLMRGQQLVIPALTNAVKQPRRPLYIRKQEGDSPSRELSHPESVRPSLH